MDLKLSERPLGGCTVIELHGELDLSSAPGLRERLLAGQAARLILDLSGLAFMDSTGLKALLDANRRARLLGGALTLAAPQKIVSKMLTVTGLDAHFTILPTVAAALSAEPA